MGLSLERARRAPSWGTWHGAPGEPRRPAQGRGTGQGLLCGPEAQVLGLLGEFHRPPAIQG